LWIPASTSARLPSNCSKNALTASGTGPATGNPDMRSASAGVTPRKLLSVALSTPSLTVVTWIAPIVRL